VAVLCDSSSGVRWRAAEALERLADTPVAALLAEAATVEALVAAFRDGQQTGYSTPLTIAGILAQIDAGRAVDLLIEALGSSDDRIREGMVELLGQLGDRRAIPPLITMLSDPSSHVRTAVAAALQRLGDTWGADVQSDMGRAVDLLIEALGSDDGGIRKDAA